jgi:hypothetical protein
MNNVKIHQMQMGILEHGLTMAMTHPETEQVKQ